MMSCRSRAYRCDGSTVSRASLVGILSLAQLLIRSIGFALALLTLSLSLALDFANGQDEVVENVDVELERNRVESLIGELEAIEPLDDAQAAQLAQIEASYRSTLASIQKYADQIKSAQEDEAGIANVETLLAETEQMYAETSTRADPSLTEDLTLQQVIAEANDKRNLLTEEQERVVGIQNERDTRTTRRREIRDRVDEVGQLIAGLQIEVPAPPPGDFYERHLAAINESNRWAITALRAETVALETELRRYDEEVDLLTKQNDLAQRRVILLTDEVRILDSRREELQQSEAQAQAVTATQFQQQFGEYPLLVERIDRIIENTSQRKYYATLLSETNRELTELQNDTAELLKAFKRLRDPVENVGTTPTLGRALRKQRTEIPSSRLIRNQIRDRQELIREVELDLYATNDQRDALSNPDQIAEQLAARTGLDSDEILELLMHERDVTESLQTDINETFDQLVNLNTNSARLTHIIDDQVAFIDENILWISSNDPIWAIAPRDFGTAIGQLLSRKDWARTLAGMQERAIAQKWLLALVIGVFAVLFWQQRRMRDEIERIANELIPVTSFRFQPTFQALLLTIFIAGTWPLVISAIGWLAQNGTSSHHSIALGRALLAIAGSSFVIEFFRQAGRKHGLGPAHFRWPARVSERIRQTMRWAIVGSLPIALLHSFSCGLGDPVAGGISEEAMRDTIQRFSFIVLQATLVGFGFYLFRPRYGVFQEHIEKYPEGWIHRLRFAWLGCLLGVPLSLIGLAVVGYLYTAEQLFDCLQFSFLWLAFLAVCFGLFTRWVLLNRRRLRLQQMREHRENAAVDTGGLPTEGLNDVDLKTINDQSKRLIRTALVIFGLVGLYLIWAQVLPALEVLDRIQFWSVEDENGNVARWITLKSVLLILPLLMALWALTRNVPGLLEIGILQRLPLDSSIRYAITTIVRYAITMIGIALLLNTLGIGWSNIQFVVAALGVGLGFGLQEIFANFVSGVILLFERPIRIGDVVTMGDVTGVVRQIKIRATTITNWDRKDFIVPNKDLVTGRVLNWTLSDTSNRITFNVGAGYDSKPSHVTEVLLSVLTAHPKIVDEPAPMVTLEGFDDSSLRFVVRGYIDELADRLTTIHQLHEMIFERFADEAIEIAFPQLDVHVRSVHKPSN